MIIIGTELVPAPGLRAGTLPRDHLTTDRNFAPRSEAHDSRRDFPDRDFDPRSEAHDARKLDPPSSAAPRRPGAGPLVGRRE